MGLKTDTKKEETSFSVSGHWHVSKIFQQLLLPKRLFSENAEIKKKKKKKKKLEFSKKSFNALTTPGTALFQDYFSLFLAILHGMKDFIPQSGIETIPHAVEALSLNNWTMEV